METIDVCLGRDRVPISLDVFRTLFQNSSVNMYRGYSRAIENGRIPFSNLKFLAGRAEIPYPLFFAPLPLVEAQVKAKTDKLLAGTSKTTFSVNSRGDVDLNEVGLIVKDLLRKQETLKRLDPGLKKNQIVGLLRRPGLTPEADALVLRDALGLSRDEMLGARNREALLDLMIARLEANQVLVSQSSRTAMPQLLRTEFSGLTLKDNKIPYIFLAGDPVAEEPVGRKIFTLALLTVLVARKIFAPVRIGAHSEGAEPGREYDIAAAMLMPGDEVASLDLETLDDITAAAERFKVTPSAMTIRAMRLRLVEPDAAGEYLAELRRAFASRAKSGGRTPYIQNAMRKYVGREMARRMFDVLDAGRISPGEFSRVVCVKKIAPADFDAFREAVR
ncbi:MULTISPECIES: ImmA/IrrE family metallo-endopeptidase [Mycobacteriales]|uniref:Uncharacterized protein n=2 Tax=Gordonia TaxID=2053 RepID=A0AAE4R5L1_9ACTN|nr:MULTISPECIES: hypothetical protein [Mycobacteriales]MDV6312118.1 hypothetical protein [Gordonia amicalis]HNP55913.1 hypothetical protein [Gordonia sp. (in: high G+C Gram-positive bacteria)]HRC51972.1 hypothetical protein [Gordonia sp. (in: high G+C Gram-positive bacteria)]